jgi:hypothetical protein
MRSTAPPRALAPPAPVLLRSWRRTAGSLLATLTILVLIGGAAGLTGATIARLVESGAPHWIDVVSVVWTVLAAAVALHLLRGPRPLRRLPGVPVALQTAVRRLLERSIFGTGATRSWTATNPDVGLHRITAAGPAVLDGTGGSDPRAPVAGDADTEARRRMRGGGGVVAAGGPGPTIDLRDHPLVLHEVRRGETFWNLAEEQLGDGQLWAALRQLNLGRTVAPGTVLDEQSILRRGWQIVLPVLDGDGGS